MRYLLDTHMILWAATLDDKLPLHIFDELKNPENQVSYSVIAPWELAIKEAKGKLQLPDNFFNDLPNLGFDCLDISSKHIGELREIPKLHGDPFDRMLVAQAKAENMILVTGDKRLAEYPIKLLTC